MNSQKWSGVLRSGLKLSRSIVYAQDRLEIVKNDKNRLRIIKIDNKDKKNFLQRHFFQNITKIKFIIVYF